MDLEVARLCPSCGKPVGLSADLVPLCSDCQRQSIVTSSPAYPADQQVRSVRPPWTLATAVVVLLFFMLAMIFIPALVVGIWAQVNGIPFTPAGIMNNPQAILVDVVAILGVHVLTWLIAWTVVTGWERRFTDVIDWSWHRRFRLPQALATVVLLYGLAWLLQHVLPTGSTDFEKLLETSQVIRIAIAVLAVVTAPLVEELVYRGILYPAVEVKFGRATAILAVGGLFALVHFMQYWGSPLILVSLTLLSFVLTVVRAYTGKLLPCFVIHLVYNFVGATLIFVEYGVVR